MLKQIEQTFREERSRILSFIRKKVADPEQAEDILQDVFYKAVEQVDVTQPVANLAAWLFQVARNRIIDWYRKKRLPQVSLYTEDEGVTIESMIGDSGIDLEKDFVRKAVMEALEDALDELPEAQAEVFVAQSVEGRSFRELSEEWNVSINTLLARKAYAVKQLRKRLMEIKEIYSEYL
ncbi:MAG: sigma-70 family RNA polymerase sigma factor [Spirochaetales bacterium]|nr:sigma-70 family RNA polymerase sigma factor [Spirochaetales bacterium]